jgi:hypothetical protein
VHLCVIAMRSARLFPLAISGAVALSLPSVAQQEPLAVVPATYLVISFDRGPLNFAGGIVMTQAATTIPMGSMEQCQAEGRKVQSENNREIRTIFWCVEGVRSWDRPQ